MIHIHVYPAVGQREWRTARCKSFKWEENKGQRSTGEILFWTRRGTFPFTLGVYGDGETRTFRADWPIVSAPRVWVNNIEQSVGSLSDSPVTSADWYWDAGSQEIIQDDAGTTLGEEDVFYAQYQGDDSWEPIVGQRLTISEIPNEHGMPFAVLWAGTIDEVTLIDERGSDIVWFQCKIVDYTAIFDRRRTEVYSWVNTTPGHILQEACMAWLSDENLNFDDIATDGDPVQAFAVDYTTFAELVRALKDLINYECEISWERKVRFYLQDTSPMLNVDDNTVSVLCRDSGDIIYRRALSDGQYANVVTVKADQYATPGLIETLEGDGFATSLQLAHPLAASPTIVLWTGSPLTSTPQTVGIDGVDTEKNWYWNLGSNTLRQSTEASPPSSVLNPGDFLEVSYTGITSTYVTVRNEAAIAARAYIEGGSGIYHKFIELNRLASHADIEATAQAELDKWSPVPEYLTVPTRQYLPGVHPGFWIEATLAKFGLSDARFQVQSVSAQWQEDSQLLEGSQILYSITAVREVEA